MDSSRGSIDVLHVDDEPDFAELAAEFLEREDERIAVETATAADEGLERLDAREFDCIVSDYDMPGRNGIDFLERVRERHPDLPFILLTGKGSEGVASEAISAGVTDYLQKQTGTDQYTLLANRIHHAVAGYRSAHEAARRGHRLEQILRTVPACVVQIDPDGQFVYANDRAESVLGLSPTEVPERSYNDPEWNIRDLEGNPIPDEELPFRRVLDTSEPVYDYRHSIEWPDGTRKVLRVNGAPLLDDKGQVRSTIFALSDVTDQQERQRDLRRVKEEFETVFNEAEDAIFLFDVDGDDEDHEFRLRRLNPAHEAISGLSTPEDRGKTPRELLGESAGAEVAENYRRCVEAREAITYEEALEMPAGTIHWKTKLGPVVRDGEVTQLVGIARDVGERKARERALERYRMLVETVGDPMYVLDDDGYIEMANSAMVEALGADRETVIGSRIGEYMADGDFERGTALIRDLLADPDQRWTTFEMTAVTAAGDRIPAETNIAPLRTESGDYRGSVGVVRDISDRKARERELERQNERLDEFIGVVSHDLRNPLTVANGHLELAREECESDHLPQAARALDRMETLLDDMLSLARAGESVGDPATVSLPAVVEGCWQTVVSGSASLVVDAQTTISADETRLRQLLENLLANAVEHGGDAVTITVGDLPDGFYVEDDGPGIPADERPAVLEPGYTTTEAGTGFGLSIVQDIAEAHGWEVNVAEGEAGGARFEFRGVEFSE